MNPIAAKLNALADNERADALRQCCGSEPWVTAMAGAAPYRDDAHVFAAAEAAADALDRDGWLEAFSAHPRIGDVESLRAKFAATKDWASGEQAGVAGASEETLHRLAEQNAAYEERFGYLFIICATGKSADQMLAALDGRIGNPPDDELANAAAEQRKITLLRLRKLAE